MRGLEQNHVSPRRQVKDSGQGIFMFRQALLVLLLMSISSFAAEDQVEGKWMGNLAVGDGVVLRVVFNLTRAGDGYIGTLDSPDQGATGIPLTSVEMDDGALVVRIDTLRAQYRGELADGGFSGVFQQAGQRLALKLTRIDQTPTIARPQNPQDPLPYRVEEVVVRASGGHQLAGTLTLPADVTSDLIGIVLVSGSGPQDRDETIFEHRPFRLIADRLTKAGVAVLRYDDRGVGGSTGATPMDTSADFADDARDMVNWLEARPEIRTVGLLGHSEGGLIGTMLATEEPAPIDFLVSLAGPSVRGDELLTTQVHRMASAAQMPANVLETLNKVNRGAYDTIRAHPDRAEREAALLEYFDHIAKQLSASDRANLGIPEGDLSPMVRQLGVQWMYYFMTYDPAPRVTELELPVFAAFGELDLQVAAKQNVQAFNEIARPNPDNLIKIYPAANHLFQNARTGMINEYGELTETMAERVLDDIVAWVTAR